jgi:hypothetical protein
MNAALRLRTAGAVAVLALATALPGAALARGHHDNGLHCGQGHAKHQRAIGHTCPKHHHGHHGHGHDRDD